MLRITELKLPLDHAPDALRPAICQRLGIANDDLLDVSLFRRGYDARKKSAITLIYTVDCTLRDEAAVFKRLHGDRNISPTPDMAYKMVAQAPAGLTERPIVIGMGPCGFMAALLLAQMGFRPIVLERGKIVRERTKDTWGLWRKNTLNPESNVQFGEGGAGTFSDGKLYSQIKDPNFYGRKVLEEFVKAGAPEEIIYVSKPHVGTFRLVKMVENIRHNIVELGGEIRFEAKVDRLLREDGQVVGVELANGERLLSRHVVLAVGHSARDTFQMLHDAGVYIEAKPFAIGFRVEHPQTLVDHARFGPNAGNEILGAADYKLVHHCQNGRAAYSFCMCPGGQVVAATSEPGRVVTNGMSQYSRAERNANSALVVNIDPEDFPGDFKKNPLIGMDFQRHWESAAFVAGGGDYSAPAQKIGDFLAGRPVQGARDGRTVLPARRASGPTCPAACRPTSSRPCARRSPPSTARSRASPWPTRCSPGLRRAPRHRIRIKRGADFQSINTRGLYPAGEGAGYAGGILSAGVDGIKVAEAVALSLLEASGRG